MLTPIVAVAEVHRLHSRVELVPRLARGAVLDSAIEETPHASNRHVSIPLYSTVFRLFGTAIRIEMRCFDLLVWVQ